MTTQYNQNNPPFQLYPQDHVWINRLIRTLSPHSLSVIAQLNQMINLFSHFSNLSNTHFQRFIMTHEHDGHFIQQMTNMCIILQRITELLHAEQNHMPIPIQIRHQLIHQLLSNSRVLSYVRIIFNLLHVDSNFLNTYEGGAEVGAGLKNENQKRNN